MASNRPSGVDGPLFKRALLGSLSWLSANHEEVNRLNVFPVPDGDTGTNMLLTLQSAVEDIKDSNAAEVSKIAKLASHGSLMGARGNSGVILSQIFRGFARAVEGKSSLTPRELAGAFEEAANAAYRAVNKPTEGTILTVAREAGRAATAAAAEPDATVPSVIAAAAAGAQAAVLKTPSQLQILREAGVVDAGGFGLQIILEGMLKTVEEAESIPARTSAAKPSPAAQAALELPEGGWGYCTEFLIEGAGLDVEAIRNQIEALGNSVLVVGEPELVKVHVHTDDPTRVIALAGGHGKLLKLNVGDMSTQHKRILESESATAKPPRANGVGLVAVVAGSGLVEIFRGLGVDAIVEGGQTMNPSTQDMLIAI
jgi:DAK2 domain fusion protein YloV